MSFSLVRSVLNNGPRLLGAARQCVARVEAQKIPLTRSLEAQSQRGLTRSLWYMCSADRVPVSAVKRNKTCGCCGMHTEGDRELVDFLSDEIKLEKKSEKSPGQLSPPKGFELSTDDAEVTFTKKLENETITVKFNVNNTVQDENPMDFDEGRPDSAEAQMVSKPPFIVEITKSGDVSMAIQCVFPDDQDIPMQQGEQDMYDSLIEIEDVAIYKKGGEWSDQVYAVSGAVMDGTLYDMLLRTLEERGIDGTFVDQLAEFSTAYEHKKYISFLESLQKFTES